jgi:TP901 family phage tail tape measure protein
LAIKATIELEGKDALRTITALEKGIKGFGKTGVKSVSGITSAVKVFQGVVGAQVALKALSALGRQFSEGADRALEFGRTIQEINSIAPRTAQETLVLKNALLQVSNEFGSDAQKNARAFYNIVSAGVKGTAQQLKVLETANRAATAGLVDIDTSARVLVSSVNAYATSGLTATEASDVLFTTVKAGITTFGELANSVGTVAPLASAAGLKFSELGGTLAFLTKNGLSTDEAATQLRATITSFIKPAEEARKKAKELGIDFSTNAIRSKGFANVLKEIIVATKGNEQELAKLFPNVRALSGVIAIAKGDFEDFESILASTANSAGATGDALDVITQSAAFQLDKLVNQLKNFSTSVLTQFEAPIADALKVVNDFISENGLQGVGIAIEGIINAFQFFNKVASTTGQFFNFLSVVSAEVAVIFSTLPNAIDDFGNRATEVIGSAVVKFLQLQEKVLSLRIAINEFVGDDEEAAVLSKEREELQKNIAVNERALALAEEATKKNIDNAVERAEAARKEADEIRRLAEEDTANLQKSEQERFNISERIRKKIQAAREQERADRAKRREEEAQADRKAAADQLQQIAQVEEKKRSLLEGFADARKQEAAAQREEEIIARELATEEDFLFLEENLGREQTLRELARIQRIEDEKKQTEEIKKLRSKARDEEKKGILQFRKFEDLTASQRVAAQKSTLSTISSLTSSTNSTLFAIGKASSLALAGINVAEGVTKALSAFPPPFNFAAAAAVGAAGAVQIAQIASAKKPSAGSFQSGGLVDGPSQTGDRLTANVNAGEVIFNRRQQQNLFNAVNQGELGGDTNLTFNVESATGQISESAIDNIIDAINDRTEFGNKRLGGV